MCKQSYQNSDVPRPFPKPIMQGMTLNKASEVLTFENNATLRPRNDPYWQAVELGIEALKLVEQLQHLPGRKESFRLPGETKE